MTVFQLIRMTKMSRTAVLPAPLIAFETLVQVMYYMSGRWTVLTTGLSATAPC